ncbi:hypothetical protein MMC26_007590 [Xylographa opegraphella]|nr:hypothetical protein [Xylographa opegraphella]
MNRQILTPVLTVTDQPYAPKPGGSVRAARERALVGLPPGPKPQRLIVGRETGEASGKSQHLQSTSNKFPPYSENPQRNGQNSTHSNILGPISNTITLDPSTLNHGSIPQWPLLSEDDGAHQRKNDAAKDSAQKRGVPPQRPSRPPYIPSILDTSRSIEHTPPSQHRQPLSPPTTEQQLQGAYWERNHPSSLLRDAGPLGTPKTRHSGASFTSSRPSTSSSVGSIPDFPIPAIPAIPQPQVTRRVLGPPPSSRRGASSYYSQSSYVTPIPEEASESIKNSHDSYALSHAMPTHWDDGLRESYVVDANEDENEVGDGTGDPSLGSAEHYESTSLVQKSTLGTQEKAQLTSFKGREKVTGASTNTGIPLSAGISKLNMVSRAIVANAQVDSGTSDSATGGRLDSDIATVNGTCNLLGQLSSTDHNSTQRSVEPIGGQFLKDSALDPRVGQILGGLEKGGALNPCTPSPITSPSSNCVNRTRRPHVRDLEEIKGPEVRGSLTSLPELIRRATKLASNLDRGKTASRLGLFDIMNANERKGEKESGHIRSGTLTNMLASFPPPALNSTPVSLRGRPTSRWPSPFTNADGLGLHSSLINPKPEPLRTKGSRRCCGMPLCAFALLMILLFLLIAAAVIIPVTLTVIPRQNAQAAKANLVNCQISSPCGNGGTTSISGDMCSCICANGFTGTDCGQVADAECMTINVNSNAQSTPSYNNATVGTNIPRLISASFTNYSIPLNYTAILSAFSATNLSCSAENALVQFNGASQRRGLLSQEHLVPSQTIAMSIATHVPRAAAAQNTPGVATSNSVVFAVSTTTPSVLSTLGVSITESGSVSTLPATTTLPNGQVHITQRDLDFARTAVLYILQQSSLTAAITAQQSLQGVLIGSSFVAGPVQVGNNATVNFEAETISLMDGIVVGGKAS